MKILITGGAGFIGSNLARYINQHAPDVKIAILDDMSNGREENLTDLRCDFTLGSILDMPLLTSLMDGVDSVVHLAALGSVPRSVAAPRPTHEANVTGTLNVLEAARARGVDQVIVASSSSVYGSNPSLPKTETDWTRPMSPYGVSKLATEGYTIAYNHTYGMKTLAFRFFNVFGPGQPADHAYAAVIPKFLDAALNRRPLQIHGDGLQSRDFTYVRTVTQTLWSAVQRGLSSRDPINLAYGTNTSLMRLVELIGEEIGSTPETEHTDTRVGDVRASQGDGVSIRALFPELSPVSLEDGLRETVNWFKGRQSTR
jgi:UDP-glucose 4-epimerase